MLKLTSHGGRTTVDALAEHSMVSRDVALEVVSRLLGEGFDVDCIEVAGDVRLSIVLECLKDGAPAETLARHVSWKDFEALSAKILGEYGFSVLTNVRLRLLKKRFEVDVMAGKDSTLLVFDCKRWSSILSGKRLSYILEGQVARCRMLAEYILSVLGSGGVAVEIIPVVLTLYGSSKQVENGVAIVPINLLGSFVERLPEIKYDLGRINVKLGSALDVLFERMSGVRLHRRKPMNLGVPKVKEDSSE